MGYNSAEKAPDAVQDLDVTELMAAVAILNDCEPPPGRVTVPISTFPGLEKTKREEAEATAVVEAAAAAAAVEAAKKAEKMAERAGEVGCQMPDGTFYLGRFIDKNGKLRDWFAAASNALNNNGQRLSLNFNAATAYAKASKAHDHDDWMLPPARYDRDGEPDILKAIFNLRAKIGGFAKTSISSDALYWSSSSNAVQNSHAKYQRFSDGEQFDAGKKTELYVRLVRSVEV